MKKTALAALTCTAILAMAIPAYASPYFHGEHSRSHHTETCRYAQTSGHCYVDRDGDGICDSFCDEDGDNACDRCIRPDTSRAYGCGRHHTHHH